MDNLNGAGLPECSDESVAMAFTEKFYENKKLMLTIELFRRKREIEKLDAELIDNEPVPTDGTNKVKRAIIDNTINAYYRMETQRINDKKKQCVFAVNKIKDENKELELNSDITREQLKSMIDEFFVGDTCGFRKTLFTMIMCMSNDDVEPYIYGDETLKEVSAIMFDDETRIGDIVDRLHDNYFKLINGGFWERNKYVIIGAGISLALITVLTPAIMTLHAASSAILTSCLAQIGHCAPGMIGAGIAKVTEVAVIGAAILGSGVVVGIGIGEAVRKKRSREAFKDLDPNELAALLAMKATLIDFAVTLMDCDTYKTELDECLNGLNDLRADAEYTLIVEKSDAENSKKKIKICNRFVKRLASIVGL